MRTTLTVSALLVGVVNSRQKIFELYDRSHFHDLVQDSSMGIRSANVVAFYREDAGCMDELKSIGYSTDGFPEMDNVMFGQYELTTIRDRIWYKWEDILDLAQMIGLNDYIESVEECGCPILAFIPASYSNEIGDWYLNEGAIDKVKFWQQTDNSGFESWREWVWDNLRTTVEIATQSPYDFEVTVTPHPGRMTHAQSLGLNESRAINIDAMQSSTSFEAFIGDSFYISKTPNVPSMVQSELRRSSGLKPTTDAPMTYSVYASDFRKPLRKDNTVGYLLEMIEVDKSGKQKRWGFDTGKRKTQTANLIRRRHITTCTTHTRNLVAPPILPKFGPIGFKKMPMPPGLHDRLKKYYRSWFHKHETEGWDLGSTQINFHDVKTYMISLDHNWQERDDIAKRVMRPILEEWTNTTNLKFNAFYGIREYDDYSMLRSHIDRFETHVLSAILQIGQTELNEPWTLEVFDYEGNRVQIELAPGEIALYESHALIHGRPKPLNGTRFANAFVHFSPPDWDWSISKVYRTPEAQAKFKLLHVTPQSIFR